MVEPTCSRIAARKIGSSPSNPLAAIEVAQADIELRFVHVKAPQACRKSLAELVDANERAFRASRWRRGAASYARECIELTVEGDRGFESPSLHRRVRCEPGAGLVPAPHQSKEPPRQPRRASGRRCLADIYGRKRVFFAGAGLFLFASTLCGLAWGMLPLMLFRGSYVRARASAIDQHELACADRNQRGMNLTSSIRRQSRSVVSLAGDRGFESFSLQPRDGMGQAARRWHQRRCR
jgi:hypothetical protein